MFKIVCLLVSFLVLLSPVTAIAQFADPITIESDVPILELAIAADLDGDNDLDILTSTRGDHAISWYENLDGLGNFGSKVFIDDNLDQNSFVNAADLDGDNDLDVIASTYSLDIIVWYENLDGLGNFGPQILVTDQVVSPRQTIAVDLDGDNDLDLVSTSREDYKLAWYENEDGNGSFGPQQFVDDNIGRPDGVVAADIDGDNDMDIVATANGDKRVYWYENLDGNASFGPPNTIVEVPVYTGYHHVAAGDLDGDEDPDVVTVEFGGQTIAWHENLDGAGDFGPKQILTDQHITHMAVIADLDRDGDNDILSGGGVQSQLFWYENLDGQGTFSEIQIISEGIEDGVKSVYAADLDGDTDNDIIVANSGVNLQRNLNWYENIHTLGVDEHTVLDLTLHPNPVNDLLQITTPLNVEQAAIYDLSGRLMQEYAVVDKQVDVSGLASGVYLISVEVEVEGSIFSQKLVKN